MSLSANVRDKEAAIYIVKLEEFSSHLPMSFSVLKVFNEGCIGSLWQFTFCAGRFLCCALCLF